METSPEEQLNELLKIEDEQDRMEKACEKFTKLEISAKTIRAYFETLDSSKKIQMLDLLYDNENRKSNMERIPPSILISPFVRINNNYDIMLYGKLLKYKLIHMYESAKTEQKFYRVRNAIMNFLQEETIPIYELSDEYGALIQSRAYSERFALREKVKGRIREIAINGFIEDLKEKIERTDIKPIGLPAEMTIGTEMECIGASYNELSYFMSLLKIYGVRSLNDFTIQYDGSVHEIKKNGSGGKRGAEVVSPILLDTWESWEKLQEACAFLQAIGCRVNRTCGGHIHIGENVMGVDKKAWETLLKVWSEAEPLIYVLSNRKGENSRKDTDQYARETATDIDRIDWSQIRIKSEEDIKELSKKVYGGSRYKALNLQNIEKNGKNTIEFRLSNGTIDYSILRENILLYGRLIQMAKMHSIDPSRKKKQLESFFENNISVKEKLERFLDLVFDSEEEKKIFRDRWTSKVNKKNAEQKYSHHKPESHTRRSAPAILDDIDDWTI